MSETAHSTTSDRINQEGAGTGHPSGDIDITPARTFGVRHAVLAGLAVSAVASVANLDLATYTGSMTTCCG